MVDIAVVGGGIAGLAAAWELIGSGAAVTVFESTDRVGGKLRTESVAGTPVDVGAESMLGRRPEVRQLLAELDLEPTAPAQVGASIWSRGALRAMPKGTLMGVPSDAAALAGLLEPGEVARAADEQPVRADGDLSVGDAVEQAFGAAVVDRLVEPLLGGVYAGDARYLSLQACVPVLYDAVRRGQSLQAVAASASRQPAAAAADQPPVFAGLAGGVGSLPVRLADALRDAGATIRTGTPVVGLDRPEQADGGQWRLVLGDGTTFRADAVVLATPAPPTAKLLAPFVPAAADELRSIEYASMAVITYAFPASVREQLGQQSGFLVPPVDARRIKASTFSSVKWPWLGQQRPDLVFVRASAGRFRESDALRRPDAVLAADGLTELRAALGALPAPVAAQVQRWGGGLPQYAIGHVDRVSRLRSQLASLPAVSVAGAAYDGVGIPACIASGRTAARTVLDQLKSTALTEGRS